MIDAIKVFLHRIIEINVSKHILGVVFESIFPGLPSKFETSNYPTHLILQVKLEAVWPFINHFEVASVELMVH